MNQKQIIVQALMALRAAFDDMREPLLVIDPVPTIAEQMRKSSRPCAQPVIKQADEELVRRYYSKQRFPSYYKLAELLLSAEQQLLLADSTEKMRRIATRQGILEFVWGTNEPYEPDDIETAIRLYQIAGEEVGLGSSSE